MELTNEKLKQLLVGPGHVSEADFETALKEAASAKEELTDVLIDKDLIKDEELGQLMAQDRDLGFVNLRLEKIDEKLLKEIPEIVAERQGVIAFSRDAEKVKVGMIDPASREIIHILEKKFGQPIAPYLVTRRDLEAALIHYRPSLADELEKTIEQLKGENLPPDKQEVTVSEVLDLIIRHAYLNHASDIHIEPQREETVVRFRIDGVMHRIAGFSRDIMEPFLMRIKIMAKMRTDEHFAAQDGKLQYQVGRERVDIRVSIVPVTEGENAVMRLLSVRARQLDLKNLGFSKKDLAAVKNAIKDSRGMVLSTGPTGCGKTTTLYALLNILNTPDIHISTIEDPVEYDIAGVSQIQVNPKTNLNFAQGLRAIVRQDPDIIMVGEIRDKETADIAVNSAMTGHLVLSTMHANDAATTLPRLIDMGIEPYLISTTVNVIIGQRLVRQICQKCRYSYALKEEEAGMIKNDQNLCDCMETIFGKDIKEITLYRGEGCKVCAQTGYSGRIGLFEVLKINDDMKKLVIGRAASGEIEKAARANGMRTMLEDGLDKAFNGMTTLEEVIRVTRV